jgi:Beta-lactamase superfamily domain
MKYGLCVAAMLLASHAVHADRSFVVDSSAPACRSLTPALIGGPMPPKGILTLRWLGTTNFELAYDGQVILLDTYYDRGPRNRPIGFAPRDVKRADVIFIGHAHYDHMSDVATVAAQTGAPVVGAPTVTETAISTGLPAQQAVTVRGGEVLKYKGFTAEAILARHSTLDPEVLSAFRGAITKAAGAPTPEEEAAETAIRKRGTFDPKVITEGTIAYLFTFESGFRLIFRNSAGPITDAEKAVMQRVGGKTDVAIVAYMGQYVAGRQIAATLPIIELYRPGLYLPAHHDEIAGTFLDIGLEPLFMAIKDRMPETSVMSPLYREPVCLNVQKK